MSNYPCKMCSETMMIMGYCNQHWQQVKATWTPNNMNTTSPVGGN